LEQPQIVPFFVIDVSFRRIQHVRSAHSWAQEMRLVSHGNRIPSLCFCRSWAKVSDFYLDEESLSNHALGRRGSGFSGLFQQI